MPRFVIKKGIGPSVSAARTKVSSLFGPKLRHPYTGKLMAESPHAVYGKPGFGSFTLETRFAVPAEALNEAVATRVSDAHRELFFNSPLRNTFFEKAKRAGVDVSINDVTSRTGPWNEKFGSVATPQGNVVLVGVNHNFSVGHTTPAQRRALARAAKEYHEKIIAGVKPVFAGIIKQARNSRANARR